MTEIVFVVEPEAEGGYSAHAQGTAIFTQGETWAEIEQNAREAVLCHFDETERPTRIRLTLAKEALITV